MSVEETRRLLPDYLKKRQQEIFDTLFGDGADKPGLLDRDLKTPERKVVGLTGDELAAAQLGREGIGSFQRFIDSAEAAQQAGLGATQLGTSVLAGSQFEPTEERLQQFMDPYQKLVTDEALKEIDRQAAIASNQLAGKAAGAGAFGGSRFGLQQSELARSAQDLRSRRIFEDMSRNFQQAQAASQAANQQRAQAAQVFGQLGTQASGIGQNISQLGGAQQQGTARDVQMLSGIGGLQRQVQQQQLDAGIQNFLAKEQLPFDRVAFASNILAQQSPFTGSSQTISPFAGGNPYLQAAGAIGGLATGLGSLIG